MLFLFFMMCKVLDNKGVLFVNVGRIEVIIVLKMFGIFVIICMFFKEKSGVMDIGFLINVVLFGICVICNCVVFSLCLDFL